MTREQYIEWRNNNNPDILYEEYKKNFNPDKHGEILTRDNFFMTFELWPYAKQVYFELLEKYDIHFNVLKIPDKQGQYFKFL